MWRTPLDHKKVGLRH